VGRATGGITAGGNPWLVIGLVAALGRDLDGPGGDRRRTNLPSRFHDDNLVDLDLIDLDLIDLDLDLIDINLDDGDDHPLGAATQPRRPLPSAAPPRARWASSNERLAVQVGPALNFNMGAFPHAAGGAGPDSWDLIYSWPNTPGTSFTSLRVDGNEFDLRNGAVLEDRTVVNNDTGVRARSQVGPVEVTQLLELAHNPST